MKVWLRPLCAIAFAATVAACGHPGVDDGSTPTPIPTALACDFETNGIAETSFDTHSGRSLDLLRKAHPKVFVGIVEGVREEWAELWPPRTLVPRPGVTVTGTPWSGEPPKYVRSHFSVRVVEVIEGPIRPDELVTIYQAGGEVRHPDDRIECRSSGGALLRVGGTYLIFAQDHPAFEETLSAPDWALYRIEGDRMSSAAGDVWEHLLAVRQVSGMTLPELRDAITAASKAQP